MTPMAATIRNSIRTRVSSESTVLRSPSNNCSNGEARRTRTAGVAGTRTRTLGAGGAGRACGSSGTGDGDVDIPCFPPMWSLRADPPYSNSFPDCDEGHVLQGTRKWGAPTDRKLSGGNMWVEDKVLALGQQHRHRHSLGDHQPRPLAILHGRLLGLQNKGFPGSVDPFNTRSLVHREHRDQRSCLLAQLECLDPGTIAPLQRVVADQGTAADPGRGEGND